MREAMMPTCLRRRSDTDDKASVLMSRGQLVGQSVIAV